MYWRNFIQAALEEDVREGDHTSLSCISDSAKGNAQLHIKDNGILAGVELAQKIFQYLDPTIQMKIHINDGATINKGQIAFEISGNARSILTGERLALNCMQRMSGIATLTNEYVRKVEGYNTVILDTRKTTPLFRTAEKWAVKIGGGHNHRFGLFDMILIKDNHIDYAGGIVQAIEAVKRYQDEKNLKLKVEIEARSIEDVELILKSGYVNRIMLDNFSLSDTSRAVAIINNTVETEASGGVTLETVRDIASTGVNYISVGALTHSYRSLDLSLKAKLL
ncbi:MAG: carboxylating nicotinate-nucleotide diphosphorylase [Chitinophagaceae bacterium]|nr:carboxylating nicotinate-nucleotide diphosphorylase [Chitinophagaceae bacterium]